MPFLTLLLVLLQAAGTPLAVPALDPPTRVSQPNTPEELTILRAGIALYDQKRYDEAIARYQEVLQANPDNVSAMYELALTYSSRGELQKAFDLAAQGAAYNSPVLPQFYGLIGNNLDGAGEPQKAVEVYRKGIAVAPNAGVLYYNLGVTYERTLKDRANAKSVLKQGAIVDPNHPSIQILLAVIFAAEDLKTPALFAASRFLVLEPGTARTAQGYNVWRTLLNGNAAPPADAGGPIQIRVNPAQSKEEGNLTQLDLDISMSKALAVKTGAGKSQIESLVWQLDNLFAVYSERQPGDDGTAFLWTHYMPYFREMKQRNFVEPFVYFANQRTNLPGVREWLTANRDRVTAFLEWSRNYPWPKGQ